jgi:hypothetical protein
MQLSASEQHCAMASSSEPSAPAVRDAAEAKQHEFSVDDHSINPLIEEGVLQQILGYVGPGLWVGMSLVSKAWRQSYLQVPEQQIIEYLAFFQTDNVEITCKTRMTLLKAAVASASMMKLACDCGLPVGSRRLQYTAGRWGDIATLTAAFECGMPQSSYICAGAARGGCLDVLMWLIRDQKCPAPAVISVLAAGTGSIPVLDFLKQRGTNFTVETACGAAAAGHQHIIEHLHTEGCPFDSTVCLHAAASGHVHVLQRLRELECDWDSARLCKRAAERGLVHVLQWAKQQGSVFTAEHMVEAAMFGHTAVCEYLLAQQCPCDIDVCTAAALHGQLGTLQWLLEHGCAHDANALWLTAAARGHITVLSYLQQIALVAAPADIFKALFMAGAHSHLATAQWLRAQGTEWPAVLTYEVDDELLQWEGAVLEWARAEGCTSPLE